MEDNMITCKLCKTKLEKKHLRRDGSMLCPVCGQIYWKAAVDKAIRESVDEEEFRSRVEAEYIRQSRLSTERIARRVQVA